MILIRAIAIILLCNLLNCVVLGSIKLSPDSEKSLSSVHNSILAGNERVIDWYKPISQRFRDRRNASAIYEGLSIDDLRTETAKDLTNRLFVPRRNVLKEIVRKAEESAGNYVWDKDIWNVTYRDSKNFTKHYYIAEVADGQANRFGKPVNFTFSTVHVPIETFIGGGSVEKDTMHGIDWSNQLDNFFEEAENEVKQSSSAEDLMWQYYGSQQGFVRHYPGSQWTTPNEKVDLYDSRRRPWFNQASSSPKDVLIMIDTSGSTAGQTLYLMTLTAQKLLDTLGENDFVQVANFSDAGRMEYGRAQIGPNCFPSFVQATSFNKRILMNYVKALNDPEVPSGEANYDVALKYAYQTFEEFAKNSTKDGKGMGARCTKNIIILTDGGVQKPEKIISDFDPEPKDKGYRIFTYAMGQSPTPLDAVKWLACSNKGYFSKINSLGTINAGVQHFSERLSAVMASHNGQDSLLSSVYRDEWGLGMLTTLTMPVFNRANKKNVTMLGVMGVDIAIEEFDKFIDYRRLGPLSYAIVVNHNGFVIKHPNLKTQALWNIEPPSIDILDAEVVKASKQMRYIEELRDALLGRKAVQKTINDVGRVLRNGENYAYFVSYTQIYQTKDIEKTAYRLALAHPDIINKVLKVVYSDPSPVTKPNVTVLRDLADKDYEVTVSKWSYCDGVFKLTNQSTVLDGLTRLINDTSVKCDTEMVNHLLWDAQVIISSELYKVVLDSDIESVSLTTASGLSVLYPVAYNDESKFRLDNYYHNPATKRAFRNREEFIYTAEYSKGKVAFDENSTGPLVSIYRAISEVEDGPYIFGVIGVTINNTALTETLLNTEDDDGEKLCSSPTSKRCFLLDEGGFIIAENLQEDGYSHIGRWLGVVDPSLMHSLYNETDQPAIYHRHKFFDYQATCKYNWLAESSSAPRLPSLTHIAEMFLTQLTTTLGVLYNSITMYSSGAEAVPPLNYGEKYEVCTKISYQYYYTDRSNEALTRTVDYNSLGCERAVSTFKVNGTNTLLVIASPPGSQCDKMAPLRQAPKKVELEDYVYENPSVCERNQRKRIRPTECYRDDKPDFEYSCRGCKTTAASMVLLLASIAISRLFS